MTEKMIDDAPSTQEEQPEVSKTEESEVIKTSPAKEAYLGPLHSLSSSAFHPFSLLLSHPSFVSVARQPSPPTRDSCRRSSVAGIMDS